MGLDVHASILERPAEEIRHIQHDSIQIDGLEARASRARFDLRDPEQGFECRVDVLDLGGSRIDFPFGQLPAGELEPRLLKTDAKAIERRLQVVRDIGADLAHALDIALQAPKRKVYVMRKLVDVISRSDQGNTGGEVAMRHLFHRFADGVETPFGARRYQDAA
jgi:hypothetical protein